MLRRCKNVHSKKDCSEDKTNFLKSKIKILKIKRKNVRDQDVKMFTVRKIVLKIKQII